ncbi:hypothetical protein Tco_0348736 [Tanacetum coccineum]
MTELPFVDSGLAVPVFSPGDDPITRLNKVMDFITAIAALRFPLTNNQIRTSFNPRNQATIQDGRVIVQQVQRRQGQSYSGTGYKGNATSSGGNNASGHARVVKCYNCQESWTNLDEEQLAFLADPGILDGQAVQTIIPNNSAFQTEDLDTILTVMMSRMQNRFSWPIFPTMVLTLSQRYLILKPILMMWKIKAQQDSMILSVIKQMSEQMINHVNNWETDNKVHNNESVTVELERYKERVKTFEQRLNINLSSRGKMIDSQMNDMIKEKLALKEQVDSLEQNLSKQKKKWNLYCKDSLFSKMNPKKKKINIWKMKLIWKSYQYPFYLKKAQRIKPTLYDCIVISDKHVAMPVIDDEETLILEEDFGKCFVPQQELSAEQAFWYHMLNPSTESSDASPVKIEAPRELPKVSLVNESLKKLKFHLDNFDKVVKKRTTPHARTEGRHDVEADLQPHRLSRANEDEEEEEHPAPADSTAVALPAADQAPSAEETEPFETDDSSTYHQQGRDAEVARLLAISTSPSSPLSPWSSPLPQIPSSERVKL